MHGLGRRQQSEAGLSGLLYANLSLDFYQDPKDFKQKNGMILRYQSLVISVGKDRKEDG